MRVAAMASLGVRVHAPLGDAGKISRCVALGQPLIPAQAGIHLAPFFAYALWIPACAGMTHRRTTRRLSNIPALQFKMSDILTTIDAGIMTITLNRAGKKNAITSAIYASIHGRRAALRPRLRRRQRVVFVNAPAAKEAFKAFLAKRKPDFSRF